METVTTLRAVALVRMSTDRQAASPERQRALFAEYCARYQLLPVGEYADEGVSATHVSLTHREGLQRLLADASQRQFELVWCEEISRIARRGWEFAFVRDTLRRQGIPIVTVQDDPYAIRDTAIRELLQDIMAGTARYEARNLGDRVRRAQQVLVSQGRFRGGTCPTGLCWDKATGTWHVHEAAAAIVRAVYETYLATGSIAHTARQLDARGCRSLGGARIDTRDVGRMLRSPVYRGRLVYGGEEYPADLPEVVPAALVAAVDARLALAAGRPQRSTNPGNHALFSGLLRCPECGSWLNVHRSANGPNYLCWKPRHHAGVCTNRRIVSERRLERAIVPQVAAALRAAADTAEPRERRQTSAATRTAERALEQTQRERERALALHVRGTVDAEELDAMLARLEERRAWAEEQLAHATEARVRQASRVELRRVLRQVEEEWPAWPMAQRRELLQRLLVCVVVDYGDLGRSHVVWR